MSEKLNTKYPVRGMSGTGKVSGFDTVRTMDEMKREHEARIDEMKREHEARMDVLERFLRVVQSEGIETRRQTRETVRLVGVMEKSLLRIHGRVERLEETGRKG